MGEQVKHDGMTYQVTDVKVPSVVTDTDLSKFNTDTLLDGDREKETELWDQKGKLKSYIRETIQTGDGVSEPEETVAETENVAAQDGLCHDESKGGNEKYI